MVKHTQTICQQQLTNCLSVFDDFVKLVLKGLRFIFDHPLKQWWKGEKRGEDGNIKISHKRAFSMK